MRSSGRFGVVKGKHDYPVIGVSWEGAKAYVQWLSSKTSKRYRLLTEAEWEYMARARTSSQFFFGDSVLQACGYANVPDLSRGRAMKLGGQINCDDGYPYLAPVGKFKPNEFGVYDVYGNADEWVEDCWHESFMGAPVDGAAWIEPSCAEQSLARGITRGLYFL